MWKAMKKVNFEYEICFVLSLSPSRKKRKQSSQTYGIKYANSCLNLSIMVPSPRNRACNSLFTLPDFRTICEPTMATTATKRETSRYKHQIHFTRKKISWAHCIDYNRVLAEEMKRIDEREKKALWHCDSVITSNFSTWAWNGKYYRKANIHIHIHCWYTKREEKWRAMQNRVQTNRNETETDYKTSQSGTVYLIAFALCTQTKDTE